MYSLQKDLDDKLGEASIDSVRLADAKEWALRIQKQGVACNTICNSIRKPPFDFQINDDTEPKAPMSAAAYEAFQRVVENRRGGNGPAGSEAGNHRGAVLPFCG